MACNYYCCCIKQWDGKTPDTTGGSGVTAFISLIRIHVHRQVQKFLFSSLKMRAANIRMPREVDNHHMVLAFKWFCYLKCGCIKTLGSGKKNSAA